MPDYENDQAVADALTAAAQEDGFENSQSRALREAASEVTGEQANATAPEGGPEAEGQSAEESFSRLDPNSLPDEMLPYYRSMQADYTRKTQELAEQRAQYAALEQYGGVETATQALQWVESLQNPDNALALHRDLTQALVERGYDVGTAQQIAGQQVQQAQAEEMDGFEDTSVQDPRVDELQAKLDQFEQWAAQREQAEFENRLQAEMDRQEAELVRANPHYTDADLEAIYNLAHSTGFDLSAANQQYQAIQSHLLAGYIERKGTVAPGIAGVPATGSADQPQSFQGLNDPQLEKAVNRYLAEQAAASS